MCLYPVKYHCHLRFRYGIKNQKTTDMKNIFMMIQLSVLSISTLSAQRFVTQPELLLHDSIVAAKMEPVDFDNDKYLDLTLFITSKSARRYILFFSLDTARQWVVHESSVKCEDYTSYSIIDYDGDNDMDIQLFGTHSMLVRNDGGFKFSIEDTELPDFKVCKWADFNNDGLLDIFGCKRDGSIESGIFLQQLADGNWKPVGDTIHLSFDEMVLFDSDNDGFTDVFVSGKHSPDSLFTGMLLSDGNFHFSPVASRKWVGKVSAGDLNGDGLFDIFFSGKDSIDNIINRLVISKPTGYVIRDSIPQISTKEIFVADINVDGKSDLAMLTPNDLGKTVSLVIGDVVYYDTLLVADIITQRFADLDRDGDLDVVMLANDGHFKLVNMFDKYVRNEGPFPAKRVFIAKIQDRIFANWRKSVDDNTVSNSITYDVFLETPQSVLLAEFDLKNFRRLTVSHGNNLTRNFKLLKMDISVPARFIVQSIDNSFMTFNKKYPDAYPLLDCSERLKIATIIPACTNERIVLTSKGVVRWFSYSKGHIADADTYAFTATKQDTLMTYDEFMADCEALTYYIIRIENRVKEESSIKLVCEQDILKLGVESNWKSTNWSSTIKGDLGKTDSIVYQVTAADTIRVWLRNEQGCDLRRNTILRLSKPVLTTNADRYAILRGNQVHLNVNGVSTYHWTPSTSLSNPDISNPVATPVESIQYTVTGYDSLGCQASLTISIVVEMTGFIPGLFTPNDDGKNDELKIYGLSGVASFEFQIFNREGILMYSSGNFMDASQRGWDGTTNGSKQPPAIYFWKVRGTFLSGETVKLNGKSEGSLLLVR